jgi:hypothetical protein
MAEKNELVEAFTVSLREVRDDAEWKGRMTAMMEMMVKGISEIKSEQCRAEEKADKKIDSILVDVTRLRVKVAGWSALYASVSSTLMWVLLNTIFKK